MTFDGCDRAIRIGYRLALCQLANEALARLRETNYGRRQTAALRVRDNRRLAAFHDGHNGIRRT